MKRTWLVYISLGTLALFAALPVLHLGRQAQRLCEWYGGVWSFTNSQCITRACYASHTCGGRYSPGHACQGIAAGADVADVYVRLGEPYWTKDNHLIWPRGAAEAGYVVATIANGHLANIECAAAERP